MPLSQALRVLIKTGHLKPLEQRPLPDHLPPKYNPAKYCVFHQQHGHDTDQCYKLCHQIQDLIDNKVIILPQKPNVTTNPLPANNQVPSPRNLNLIHTLAIPYDPSIYITPSHLPKPAVLIPKSTDLCMMDASTLQPEPVVVTIAEGGRLALEENVNPLPEWSEDLTEGEYDLCQYIVPVDKAKPEVVLPTVVDVNVVREDGPSQGPDDLAELEEDLDNLQFYDEQDRGDLQIEWFDLNGSTKNSEWLSNEPDKEEGTEPKPEEKQTIIATVAGMAEEKGKLSESTGIKNLAQELGTVSTVNIE